MPAAPRAINNIQTVIEQLSVAGSDQQRLEIIESVPIDLTELRPYHHYGSSSYGRNLIYTGVGFEIILLCWQPQQYSTPHDHQGSLCIMKCISGELTEQRYQLQAKAVNNCILSPTERVTFCDGEVTSITDQQGLHKLGNETAAEACSLHFYFPPIHSANAYNEQDGSQKTVLSVFTSEYGVKTAVTATEKVKLQSVS
ncbi:MAG: cysteine dioxygenase family protein [Pseudomonadales bacterium]|nr:cysteine dioxygenase family protein [Pseudomonadales bacterium]NRA18724.1 cysteine dioxygenase family protein [Oceanospirillaceae bacterium]